MNKAQLEFSTEYTDQRGLRFWTVNGSGEVSFVGDQDGFNDYILELFIELNDCEKISGYLDTEKVVRDYSMDYDELSYEEMLEVLA